MFLINNLIIFSGGCYPPTFSTAPEPKRIYRNSNLTSEKRVQLPFLSPGIDNDYEKLMFHCENDYFYDSQNNNISKPLNGESVINAADAVLENKIELTNIANTSEYLNSLFNIINSSTSEQSLNSNIYNISNYFKCFLGFFINEVNTINNKNEIIKGIFFFLKVFNVLY